MATVFFSYSHKDEDLRDRLETHLAMLKRQGVIDTWHDRRISAGDEFGHEISENLDSADIILLLVSPDFLASEYCYDVEMSRAMERHAAGTTRVIPVILRHCDWHGAPFGKLLATPPDGRPVVSWPDLDEAFLHVTRAIRSAVGAKASMPVAAHPEATQRATPSPSTPRSSNLRVRKKFTEADLDRFLEDAFEYMARFFENSLAELSARNDGIETSFKRVDALRFTAVGYRDGTAAARCAIAKGGLHSFMGGITYSANDSGNDNSFNERLSAHADEQGMYLQPMGLAFGLRVKDDAHLTFEGAAEYYWSLFVEPLQH